MYHTIKEFEDDWTREIERMLTMLDNIPDSALSQAVADGHRTLGRIAWHITTTIPEMMAHTGIAIDVLSENSPMSETSKDIRHAYEVVARMLLERIKQSWTDETLDKEDDLYGEKWPRKVTLKVLVHHQIHHRGQMTVLMRQAGLKVPGLFGPAKEDWTEYGMQPPEV
jgi:uncharacterized damage-inducible protein DinB